MGDGGDVDQAARFAVPQIVSWGLLVSRRARSATVHEIVIFAAAVLCESDYSSAKLAANFIARDEWGKHRDEPRPNR